MKKILFLAIMFLGGAIFPNAIWGQPNNIPMQIINEGGVNNGPTYAPPRPWYITQDDDVLTIPAFDEGYTLQLLDEDETVVYSTYIPAGTTQVILPSTLSGDFELRLIPYMATYYFRGYINM